VRGPFFGTAVLSRTDCYSDERKIPIERADRWRVVQIPETARSALTDPVSRRPEVRLRSTLLFIAI
jgi:hypothetical protein